MSTALLVALILGVASATHLGNHHQFFSAPFPKGYDTTQQPQFDQGIAYIEYAPYYDQLASTHLPGNTFAFTAPEYILRSYLPETAFKQNAIPISTQDHIVPEYVLKNYVPEEVYRMYVSHAQVPTRISKSYVPQDILRGYIPHTGAIQKSYHVPQPPNQTKWPEDLFRNYSPVNGKIQTQGLGIEHSGFMTLPITVDESINLNSEYRFQGLESTEKWGHHMMGGLRGLGLKKQGGIVGQDMLTEYAFVLPTFDAPIVQIPALIQ